MAGAEKKTQGTSGCSSPRYVGWKDSYQLSAANCQLPADSTHLETIQRFRLVRLLMTSAMMSLITSKGTFTELFNITQYYERAPMQ